MQVVSIISTKGGVGKTTTAANLGGLAADAGLRVLLLDLDVQPTLSSYYELAHRAPGGIYELLAFNERDLGRLVSRTIIAGLDLVLSNDHRVELPVGQLLATRPHVQRQQPAREDVLVDLLARLARQLGVVGDRQVMRLVESFQQYGAATLDVGFTRCPARLGAQRARFACQGLSHRLRVQASRQLHRLHTLVDERL